MATPLHSKLINKAARDILKPIGVVRKGQSRLWLDDNGCWLTLVEFQPSSWSKGTYLNVGICWLWYPKDSFSFDIGDRVSGFIEFQDEDTFLPQAKALAEQAKKHILSNRLALSSPEAIKTFVLNNTVGDKQHIWASVNKGMACLIARDFTLAHQHFQDVLDCSDSREWAEDVKRYVQSLLVLSPDEQLDFVCRAITESRKLKKLPDTELHVAK